MGMGEEPTTVQNTLEDVGEIKSKAVEVIDEPNVQEEIKSTSVVESTVDKDLENMPVIREADILNPDYGMDVKINVATKVAGSLSKVLEQQDLVIYGLNKSNKEKGYVTVEGWNTLGTMLGITPVTESVEPFPTTAKFGYKARVSLYQNGVCLATAEAIATSTGFQKKEPDVYSMAQTRALGKVYRMALSWIMKLAGYEPTPAEEMPSYK